MSKFSTAMTASLLALVVGLATAGTSLAEEDFTHGAPYLRMGVGPRALAMGGAYVGAAEDVTAGYWNPAGLPEVEFIEASFMYSDLTLDRKFYYFGYAQTFPFGSVGFSWINSGVSDVRVNRPGMTAGTEDWNDNALIFSYGTGMGGIMIGGNAKILMSSFGDDSDTGFGIDAGVRFIPSRMMAIGVVVQDIGTQYWGESLPTNLRVGVALKSADDNFMVCADAEKMRDEDILFHLGGELQFEYVAGNYAALRAGVMSKEGREEEAVFTFGAGIWVGTVSLDYAYLPEQQDFMDTSHRIALTGRF